LNKLNKYGWNDFFEASFSEYKGKGVTAARIAVEHRNYYELYSEHGDITADKSGKLFYNSENNIDLPAVGDWVVIRPIPNEKKAVIEAVLPRKTKFSRKRAGVTTEEQVVAANIDTAFIMSSLNQDLNPRRIERYLTLAWDNDVTPVIVLNKADLFNVTRISDSSSPDSARLPAQAGTYGLEEIISEAEGISFGTPVHTISALNNIGLNELKKYFKGNKTVAVIGSSGVGKSTLINRLCEWKKMKVSDISLYKDKGRHTTSHRELTVVPGGGLIIDTPGMRELQLWEGGEGLAETFEDIEKLVLECKFSDCKHESEPGCAVKAAMKTGEIDEARFKSYKKLLNEIKYLEGKQNKRAQITEKKKWKKLSKEMKNKNKVKFNEN
jgi:ribosome biogenesis GTPase